MNSSRPTAIPGIVLLLAASLASATTIVPLSDAALVDRAAVIVEATAEARVANVTERPVTDWLVLVHRVLKGEVGASRIVVRLPGGRDALGRQLLIHGTPPIRPGFRLILFLAPKPDGTWAIIDFPQGAFVAGKSRRRNLAFRDFSQVLELGHNRVGVRDPLRDADRFADWIADRADGLPRPRDYVVQPRRSELEALTQRFTLLDRNGLNLRWFDFDSGESVGWRSFQNGLEGLSSGGADELQRGLAAWTNEPSTPIRLHYGGTTTAQGGHETFDSQNVVLWNDPNDEIEGKFDCSEGGTLASGGPWFDPDERLPFDGRNYIPIRGGDIVMNDGIECRAAFSPDFSKMIEEIVAHELGHTLGLGHSSENLSESDFRKRDALMYFRAHDDRRGARLTADDVDGLRALYLPGAGGGGGGSTQPPSGCPEGSPPGSLCLVGGRFRITASWQNQFNGLSGTAGAIPYTDVSGFLHFGDASNIELIVKILDFGDHFKVFYSQLTNLRFEMTVLDSSTGRTQVFRNTPGECGAIDATAFQSASRASTAVFGASIPAGSTLCDQNPETLCLQGGRIKVTAAWRNQYNSTSGTAQAARLSDVTGGLFFLDRSNLELLVKALDFGEYFLVIYGSLSDFEFDLSVTDLETGIARTYHNNPGNYCGALDGTTFTK